MNSCHKDNCTSFKVIVGILFIPVMLLIASLIWINYHTLTYRSFIGTLVSTDMPDMDGTIRLYLSRHCFLNLVFRVESLSDL
jgi:hypothetical protein